MACAKSTRFPLMRVVHGSVKLYDENVLLKMEEVLRRSY